MPDGLSPLFWPVAELVAAYRRGDLSPVDVAEEAIVRIERFNPLLNAVLARLDEQARRQAKAAEQAYRDGTPGPLSGVPVSVKDTFFLAGAVTTFGSALYRNHVADHDSGVVRRLRAAGAMFTGKTNAAEFGQSGTTDNRLGEDCRNPWDLTRTTGGSSGGAVASVAAGLANVAVGADGGGSIRIPAAFTGLFGLKPTYGLVPDEDGFSAMSDFICAGPFAWRVADARVVLGVLADTGYPRRATPRGLRIAWCPRPEGRPVDPELAQVVQDAVDTLSALGHEVGEVDLELAGWQEAFGPLVLAEEGRERGHLLATAADQLSDYERVSLEAAREVTEQDIASARQRLDAYRRGRATRDRRRPAGGQAVGRVSLHRSLQRLGPAGGLDPLRFRGLAAGRPAGRGRGRQRGAAARPVRGPGGGAPLRSSGGPGAVERSAERGPGEPMSDLVQTQQAEGIATVTFGDPKRRNALSMALLAELREALEAQVEAGARAVILTGAGDCFSAGADFADIAGTVEDLAVDEAVERTVAAVEKTPAPVIAAIEGPCIGAAFDLAMACDLRVASTTAFFELPAARLGILYNPRAIARLHRTLGRQTLARLVLIGERLDGEAALAAGLVSHLAPEGRAAQEAEGLAGRAAGGAPEAVASSKRLLADLDGCDFDIEYSRQVRSNLLASTERQQALARAKAAHGLG
jgi:aspartyl-tRNA(Asn)/glutamyl-tRNA(Gln) amidotransferase subunit A